MIPIIVRKTWLRLLPIILLSVAVLTVLLAGHYQHAGGQTAMIVAIRTWIAVKFMNRSKQPFGRRAWSKAS